MGLEDGVAAAPAESHGADLVGPGSCAEGIYEAVDERFGDAFTVRYEPGAQCCGYDGGVGCFFGDCEFCLFFEGGLDVLQEGDGEGVAVVEIGEVDVEAGCGVGVGEEAGVGEFPAED